MKIRIDVGGSMARLVRVIGEPETAEIKSAGWLGTGAGTRTAQVVLVEKADGGQYRAFVDDLAEAYYGTPLAEAAELLGEGEAFARWSAL